MCSIQYHDIKGKKVEVKVAQTKEALAMQQGRGRILNQRNYGEAFLPVHFYLCHYWQLCASEVAPPQTLPLDISFSPRMIVLEYSINSAFGGWV